MNIIKKARKEKGLTRREVAEYLDLPLLVYIYYENNFNCIKLKDLLLLSNLFNMDIIAWLLIWNQMQLPAKLWRKYDENIIKIVIWCDFLWLAINGKSN